MPEKKKPTLLSGGNPQIPKGDGPGPVREYVAAMPGWKGDVGRRLDEKQLRSWLEQAAELPGASL